MMNHNAVFVSRKERIQNTLCPILSQLYDKVHEKQFPLPDQIDKACSLLQQYLDELSKGPLSDVEIDFTDIPAVSIKRQQIQKLQVNGHCFPASVCRNFFTLMLLA